MWAVMQQGPGLKIITWLSATNAAVTVSRSVNHRIIDKIPSISIC